MKITDLEIDGFGVWHDLKLTNLSPRVTTFYGANEAGKTTVMQFARAVLYGVSPARRKRYLPPVEGGQPGGTLGIVDQDARFRVTRIADRGEGDVGRVVCTAADGSTSGDRLLRDALGDVDEQTFTNIFAVGLSEIQELATLSGTKAAEWLYRLTSGLDRVSLYDVISELRRNRRELLGEDRQRSRITDLWSERDRLRSEIDRLQGRNRHWSQLAVEIGELDERIGGAEREVRRCEHDARTIEIAVGLKDNWRQREKIAEQLEHLTGRARIADDAIERLNALNANIEKHQRQADILQGQRHQLRDECDRLGINELLVKNCCRIDALGEQRDWLESLDRQRTELEKEARQFENRFAAEQRRLAETLGLKSEKQLAEISEDDLERLQPQIDALRAAEKRLEVARREVDNRTESVRSLQTQIETAIVGGEQHGLPMDLQDASDLVAKLRRRLQVEQRLEQARQHELEVEQQSHELLDDQVMPLWLFGWLLAAVVIGGLMVGVSMLVPDSPLAKYGGLVALAGVGMGAFAFIFKYFTEDAAAERL
ncbi:MAG: AAA family ATPase, partial [Planctomycetales bacterium]|nr:AAA family ATPase [Planctomycetales bacterium]